MSSGDRIRDLLRAVHNQEMEPDTAVDILKGLQMNQDSPVACLDLGREQRCGIPEVILAEGKDLPHLLAIAQSFAEKAGRALITRIPIETAEFLKAGLDEMGISSQYNATGRVMVVGNKPRKVTHNGSVGIITAGTSDIRVAEEAKVIIEEMGCTAVCAYDVGVAGIHRLFPVIEKMCHVHSFVVAAGREGTLPSVVAGLVSRPVIGVPVSTGYGYMGNGEAALASMLQSCSVITVVNIDAGFVAGAFAARIASMVGDI